MGAPENEAWILQSFGLGFIGLRIWVRWEMVGIRKFAFDDYWVCVAGLVFTAETIAACVGMARFDGLTNSFMTDNERAALDPNSTEFYKRVWGSKIQLLGWNLYAFILWSLKLCIATSYKRLLSKLLINIAYLMLGVTYMSVVLTLLLTCQPFQKFWQIYPDPGNFCQPTISKVYVIVIVTLNVLTTVYLIIIPLPLLWQVNIGLRKRLPLTALFSGGVFIAIAGIIRAHVILNSGSKSALDGSRWACRETFVAIIVTNMPFIYPKIRAMLQTFKWTKKWVAGTSRSRTPGGGRCNRASRATWGGGGGGGGGGSTLTSVKSKSLSRRGSRFQVHDRPSSKSNGVKSPLRAMVSEKSMGDNISSSTTAWDSEEHIFRIETAASMLSNDRMGVAQPQDIGASGSGIVVLQEIEVKESSMPDDPRMPSPRWGHNVAVNKGRS